VLQDDPSGKWQNCRECVTMENTWMTESLMCVSLECVLNFVFFSSLSRAASPSPQSVRRVSSSRSVSGSPEPAAKKPPAPPSPVQSQSPSTNWSPAVPAKKAKSPTPSLSPARVCAYLVLDIFYKLVGWGWGTVLNNSRSRWTEAGSGVQDEPQLWPCDYTSKRPVSG
jgi:hypothetical protein